MKKLITSFLLTAMTCGFAAAADGVWIDGIKYSLSSRPYGNTGTYEASVANATPDNEAWPTGNEYSGEITVPSTIEYDGKKYTVTAFGRQAFYMQSGVTSITAPETLEEIDTQALAQSGIKSFIIPEKVKSLGLYPFMNCKNLTELVCLNPECPSVMSSTFQGVDQSKVVLYVPKGSVLTYQKNTYWGKFTDIREYAGSPVRPTSITLSRSSVSRLVGDKLTLTYTIEPADATDNTVTWKSLDPSVVTVSDDGVVTFVAPGRAVVEAICNGNKTVSANCSMISVEKEPTVDGLKYRLVLDEEAQKAHAYLIRSNTPYAGNVVIPERLQLGNTFIVKGMDANVFALNSSVTSVTIPATVDTIGFNAFRDCSALERVNISDITAWANISFRDKRATPLSNDKAVLYLNGTPVSEVNISGTIPMIKPFTFQGIKTLTKLTIGNGLRTISESAFEGCTALTDVVLPESIDSIGFSAFNQCTSLKSINLPGNLRKICGGLLANTAIKSIIVPGKVTIIDNQAFQNCTALETVELPESLKMIYLNVFNASPAIKEITCKATVPPSFFTAQAPGITLNYFDPETYTKSVLYVPQGTAEAYKAANIWKKFTNIREIQPEVPGEEAEINGLTYMLYPATKLAALKYNANYKGEIEVPAKVNRDGIEYTVNEVMSGAFDGLAAVKAVSLPSTIETIGTRAFAGTSLLVFDIPQTVKTIAAETFAGCPTLVSVGLPDKLEYIGSKAFFGSQKLRYIRSNNMNPPAFFQSGDSADDYGQAFSTEIWPACELVIPANTFMNYKKSAGWKNFKKWFYWHENTDVMASEITATPASYIGKTGESFTLTFTLSPSTTSYKNVVLLNSNPDVVSIEENGTVSLIKEGKSVITAVNGLIHTEVEVTVDNTYNGVEAIEAETAGIRYFNLQGIEISEPADGQIVIVRKGGKSQKTIFRK